MYFTAHFKQIILAFALSIVLVGQVSALPAALPEALPEAYTLPAGNDKGHAG